MEQLFSSPYFWIAATFVSEALAISPLKSNSIAQLVLRALFSLKPRG